MKNIRYLTLVIVLSGLLNYLAPSNVYAESLFKEAVQLYSQNKFTEAAIIFEQVVGSEPKNASAYYYLGLCYMQSHRNKAAKAIFTQTASRFPNTPAAAMAQKALQGLDLRNSSTTKENMNKKNGSDTSSASISAHDDNLPRELKIPYTMQGTKYMVSANINGHPLEMCVDTGCDRIIIPVEYLDEIGFQRPSVKYSEHLSSTGAGIWKEKANVQLGPLVRNKIPIDIIDTSSWPGKPLLGNIFFKGFSRSFNVSDSTLRAVREVSQSDDALSGSGECLIPFERDRYRNSPLVEAVINGRTTKVMFDTGGNNAIWITYEEANALEINPDIGTIEYVGNNRIPWVSLTVDKVKLGTVILQDVKTMIFNKSQATWGTDIICFGGATLVDYGYNFVIDDKAKVIRIRKQ